MSPCPDLLLAVLSVDPDAYGDYRLVGGVLSYTYYHAGETPRAWYPSELEALAAYAAELRDDAASQDRKSSEELQLLNAALILK